VPFAGGLCLYVRPRPAPEDALPAEPRRDGGDLDDAADLRHSEPRPLVTRCPTQPAFRTGRTSAAASTRPSSKTPRRGSTSSAAARSGR
jgi:hypothetical protein